MHICYTSCKWCVAKAIQNKQTNSILHCNSSLLFANPVCHSWTFSPVVCLCCILEPLLVTGYPRYPTHLWLNSPSLWQHAVPDTCLQSLVPCGWEWESRLLVLTDPYSGLGSSKQDTSPSCLRVFIHRRKVEIMHTHSLFTLLGERLMLHTNTVTVTTYNTLYEVTRHFPLRCANSTSSFVSLCTECVTHVLSPPPVPDSDGAGVHTGSSQTSSWSWLRCQDSEPK